MLTYKELKPILVHTARKFANYKYEVDELVNAVWLIGNVQKLPDIRFAYRRVYYDIITYLRTQEGRRRIWCTQKPDVKYRTMITSYNAEVDFANNGEHDSYEIFMGVEDDNFAEVDFEDELELLMRRVCNSCEDRLIVKMKLNGFTQKEIGKIIGIHETRISQKVNDIGKILLAELENNGVGYNKKAVKELCMERKVVGCKL